MKQKRRNHSAEFKARIALEALKGVKTVQQIAVEKQPASGAGYPSGEAHS